MRLRQSFSHTLFSPCHFGENIWYQRFVHGHAVQLQHENQRLRDALEANKARTPRDLSASLVEQASTIIMSMRKTLADCAPVLQQTTAAPRFAQLQVS
jgi:hypothetical protein